MGEMLEMLGWRVSVMVVAVVLLAAQRLRPVKLQYHAEVKEAVRPCWVAGEQPASQLELEDC